MLQILVEQIQKTHWYELIAVLFGICSVWFAAKNKILVFPTGIVSTAIYIWICYDSKLFGNAILNLFYTLMSIWGWYNWQRNVKDRDQFPITWCTKKELKFGIFLFAILFILSYFLIIKLDGNHVFWDVLLTSIAGLAMYWMTQKKIENWIAWCLSNLIAVPLFYFQGLIFSSLQYFIFLILAVHGILLWIKDKNEDQKNCNTGR